MCTVWLPRKATTKTTFGAASCQISRVQLWQEAAKRHIEAQDDCNNLVIGMAQKTEQERGAPTLKKSRAHHL